MQNFIKAEFLLGGKHPLMATHNRLIKLQKSLYMEIIAADPSASLPKNPKIKNLSSINLKHLPAGFYQCVLSSEKEQHVQKIQILK